MEEMRDNLPPAEGSKVGPDKAPKETSDQASNQNSNTASEQADQDQPEPGKGSSPELGESTPKAEATQPSAEPAPQAPLAEEPQKATPQATADEISKAEGEAQSDPPSEAESEGDLTAEASIAAGNPEATSQPDAEPAPQAPLAEEPEKTTPQATADETGKAEGEAPSKAQSEAEGEDPWEDDDSDAVYSDEDSEDEYTEDELNMPDYAQYPVEALVKEAERLLQNEPVQKIKDHFEEIRKYLFAHLDEERQEKLEQFVAEGQNEIDFQLEQPLRQRFRQLFNLYRDERKKYYQALQRELEGNLKRKEELIEQLKALVNKSETIGETFKEFNAIQAAWREIGPVPRNESATLYRNYHHHVDNFYGYIRINKQLRAMDFQKNLKEKEQLIEQVQKMVSAEYQPSFFKELQALHNKWKNVGPVEPEAREVIWNKFSELSRQLRAKRESYYQALRENRAQLLDKKRELVEKINAQDRQYQKHAHWQAAIKEVNQWAAEFKKLGRIPHPENDVVWEEFKKAMRAFNHEKNEFYKNLKKVHQQNLQAKKDLLSQAEALKDSEDWAMATEAFKKLQADWKKVGHVTKADSEKVWKAFHAACNHYFGRLSEHNKARDAALEDNLKAKKALLDELSALETTGEPKEALQAVKALIGRWKKAGPLPRGKQSVEKKFNQLIDQKFKALDMDRKESRRIQFETKMDDLSQQGGDDKLRKEKDFLQRKLNEAKMELNQLENNISFFSSARADNPLLKEAQKNIDQKKAEMDDLLERIKMLNVKRRSLKAEQEPPSEESSDSQD